MPDLKTRFSTLDLMPAPDLGRIIEQRARHLATVPGALRPIDDSLDRRRFRSRVTELLAVAAVLLLAVGLAVFVHYARTTGPIKHRPSPSPPGAGASSLNATMRMMNWSMGWLSIGPEPSLVLRRDESHASGAQVPWFDMTPRDAIGGGPISTVFLDGDSAWLLSLPAPNDTSGRADIWRTRDGGQSWQRIASITVAPWYSGPRRVDRLTFVDRQHGWLSASITSADGASMVIYRTTDGGVNWTEVSVPSGFPGHSTPGAIARGCLGGLTFTSQRDGWVPARCQGADRLFYSHDGGGTWKEQEVPAQVGASANGYHFQALVSASQDGGFVYTMFGDDSTSILFLSHDKGLTWSEQPLPASSVPEHTPPVFVGNDGWFVAKGALYETHDGGRRWAKMEATTGGWTPSQLQFLDARRGWSIASRDGRLGLIKTDNGGQTWSLEWISP